jgi:uncharacterized SAM-binding protein YcdF (DUF218 family)
VSRRLRILLGCVLLWPLVAWIGARLLITEVPLEKADAIVVLGGAASYEERSQFAAELLLAERAPRVLLTNDNTRGPWSESEQRNPFFYERAVASLKSAGVAESRIEVLPQPVTSTYEEAVLVRQYATEHKLRSILIVTSGYHSRRALWTFSKVFRETTIAIGLVNVEPGNDSPPPATWWLSRRGWGLVPTEYVKMIYYVVKYR